MKEPVVRKLPKPKQEQKLSHVLMVSLGVLCFAFGSLNNFAQSTSQALPELVVQTGSEGVYGMAVTSDGKILATGGLGTTLKIWDAVKGRELRSIATESDWTFSVAFSPDGKIVANASAGNGPGFIELWDVATGSKLRTLRGHTDRVLAVAFAHNGDYLVSGSMDKTVKIWDVASGREIRTLNQSRDVWSVAVARDGQTIACGDGENKIRLWDLNKGKKLRTLEGHTGFVPSVAFSPDGTLLASGSVDTTIKLWDVAKGKLVRTLQGHSKSVNSVSFSPDGKTLASGSFDTTVKLWDLSSGREIRTLKGDPITIQSVIFSADGRLFSAGLSALIKVWDSKSGNELLNLSRSADHFESITFTRDGRKLFSGGGANALDKNLSTRVTKLWGASIGKEFRTLPGQTSIVTTVASSPDGKMLASAGWDKVIRLWNAETGAELRALTGHQNTINAITFSPDSRFLISASGGPIKSVTGEPIAGASDDNTIRIWDAQTGREIRKIEAHSLPIFAMAMSPDGKTVASAANYGAAKVAGKELINRLENLRELSRIRLWDIASGRALGSLGDASFDQPIMTLAFSPDGRMLACGGYDKQITLWSISSGVRLNTLKGHTSSVDAIAFSPDGRLLASGSQDRSIKLWDPQTGRELRTLTGHKGWIRSLSFSPDGKMLASTGPDASIKLWDVERGTELATLFAIADEDWLVVTPDGLFDGSSSAWNKILWRFAGNTFDVLPVEAFFSDFYYPGLLTEILEGKHPHAKTNLAQLDRRQPDVALSVSGSDAVNAPLVTRSVSIKLQVSNAPAGVRDVRLFRNGSLVKVWHGDVALNDGKATLEAPIPIVAGENHLTAYGFNHDNIKSEDATLTITGAESLRRQGTAYILAVGVNSYANSQYNLKYAVADAKAFGEEFRQQQMRLGRFANVEVVSLADKDATKANILLALKKLAGSDRGPVPPGGPSVLQSLHAAQPEDAVVVYFAGHGTAQQNEFFLVPHDLGYQGSRTQLDRSALDTILAHSISDRELEDAFEQVDAGQLLLIIDACNSGQALEAEEKRRGPMNSKGLAQLAYEKGMYILTAAQSYQAALETPQHGHGYLTYALVEEGLKTANADTDPRDGQVTVREWLDYATQRVPQLQEEDARRPKPTMSTTQEQTAQQKPQRTTRQQRGRQGAKQTQQQEADKARQFERDKPQTSPQVPSEEKFLQQPRVFYRREVEPIPLVVARPM